MISANEKYYSNEKQVLNMLEIEEQRMTLSLNFDHPALLIMNVCKEKATCSVKVLLNKNHILLEKVPGNLTYLFLPNDVQEGENGYVKHFVKKTLKFWFADQVMHALMKKRT